MLTFAQEEVLLAASSRDGLHASAADRIVVSIIIKPMGERFSQVSPHLNSLRPHGFRLEKTEA